MNPDEKEMLLDHEADGIQELDNFLPRWWLWLFYITVVIFVVYMGYYHVFHVGDLPAEDYQKEVAAATGTALASATSAPSASAEPTLDEPTLAMGKTVFTTHCVVCHGQNGEGLVGPNMTDMYWLHGPAFADNVRTINEGVPIKGMISWRPILKPEEIHAVASYLWTLRGTTPPNPKAPEGEKYEG